MYTGGCNLLIKIFVKIAVFEILKEEYMALNRREFLKVMGGAGAAIAFPSVMIQGCKGLLKELLKGQI